jgi:predicted alpha/beta hydrolase family esterase
MSAGKFFFFVHGMGGSPTTFFFPSVRTELENRGCTTIAPEFRDSLDPDYQDWKQTFEAQLTSAWNQRDDLIILGHSLGGYFVLRLLGDSPNAPWLQKLIGIVLVSSTSLKQPKRRKFYAEEIKWEVVRKLKIRTIALYSSDDRNVEKVHQDLIVKELKGVQGFEYREVNGFGHFMDGLAPPVVDAVSAFL